MTRSFRQFALRGLVASLALGLVAVGGVGTSAYAAGGPDPTTPPPSSPGTSPSSPGNAGTAGTASNAPQTTPAGATGSSGSGNSAAAPDLGVPPSTGSAGSGSPASGNSANGNKGHIQVEGVSDCGTTLCGGDNDPHVAVCTFTVEMFGYPAGSNSAVVTVRGQAPSGTATVLTDGPFGFSGSTSPNGNYLDTSRTYTPTAAQLSGLTAQSQQAYHLRVEVAVNGFPAKTHVIWLDCTPAVAGSSSGLTGGRGLARPMGDTAPDASASAPDSPFSVLTQSAAADVQPAAGDAPDSSGLAFTGLDVIAALAAAVILLLGGLALLLLSRRRKQLRL